MATYRNGLSDEITLYVMEPEEELVSLQFIARHKPTISWETRRNLFQGNLSPFERAQQLGLTGGTEMHFHGSHGGRDA